MNRIAAVTSALAALRAGRELTNAAAWKKGQTVVNLLTALVALAAALGYPLPVTADGVYAIAGLLVAGANAYLTVATTSKIGLPARPADDPSITLVSAADPVAWMRPPAPVPPDREPQPEPDDHGHNG